MKDKRTTFAKSLLSERLPPGWKLEMAGDVLVSSEYGLSEPGNPDGNIPIVGMKNLANGVVSFTNLGWVDGGSEGWPHLRLMTGDILLNRTNSPDLVGKVGLVREDTDVVFASYLVRLRVDREKVDPEYLNFWLNGAIAQRALKRLSTRAVSQANINPTEFRRHCPVLLPPLTTQRKIVDILRTWDEAIDNSSRLIKLGQKLYLGLREQLIDWHIDRDARLGNLISSVNRPVPKPTSKYLALSIRSHGKGSYSRLVTDPSTVAMDTLYLVKAGDFIVNITFAWEGAVALVPEEQDGHLVSHRFPTYNADKLKISSRFLRHVIKMPRFTYLLKVISPGGAGRNRVLNKRDFLKLRVPCPELFEQTRIAEILDIAEAEISGEMARHDALKRQKLGLMQKLLTGEWRVNINDSAAKVSTESIGAITSEGEVSGSRK
jgi:type I restriction enzyme, S subunit